MENKKGTAIGVPNYENMKMNDKMILVEQLQMLIDTYAMQTSESKKDVAMSIFAKVVEYEAIDKSTSD